MSANYSQGVINLSVFTYRAVNIYGRSIESDCSDEFERFF